MCGAHVDAGVCVCCVCLRFGSSRCRDVTMFLSVCVCMSGYDMCMGLCTGLSVWWVQVTGITSAGRRMLEMKLGHSLQDSLSCHLCSCIPSLPALS